jgi:hypothetical protein
MIVTVWMIGQCPPEGKQERESKDVLGLVSDATTIPQLLLL